MTRIRRRQPARSAPVAVRPEEDIRKVVAAFVVALALFAGMGVSAIAWNAAATTPEVMTTPATDDGWTTEREVATGPLPGAPGDRRR